MTRAARPVPSTTAMPRASSAARSPVGDRLRVREEDDVVGPLAQQVRVVDGAGAGAENADRLVAHLPAVAVGAVQEVAAPALPNTRNLGEPVDRPRGDEESSGAHGRSSATGA